MFQKHFVLLTSTNCFTNFLVKAKLNQNRKKTGKDAQKGKGSTELSEKLVYDSSNSTPQKCQSHHPQITSILVLIFATWNSEETMVK